MADLIILAILALILGAACLYIYKAKKSGAKCIGCNVKGGCSGGCSGNCTGACSDCISCHCADRKK